MRGINDDTHEAARNDTSNREGDDPAGVAPGNHAPVESPDITVAESDTHDGTDDALGSGDGKGKTGGHDDGNSSAELHRETTRRRLKSETVSKVAHHVVPISPETNDDTGRTVAENPDRNIGLGANGAVPPDEEDGSKRTDSVGNVVGSVSERSSGSSQNLEEGVQVLSLVVEVSSASVHGQDVTSKLAFARVVGLSRDNVLADTVHEGVDGDSDEVLGEVPRAVVFLLNIGQGSFSG